MVDHSQDKPKGSDPQQPIDPLRRVWIPIEHLTSEGTHVFRTHDEVAYRRSADGAIRRITKKLKRRRNGHD